MAESEDLLWFVTTWESGWKDSHNIWEFERIELLRKRNSSLQPLGWVNIDLVPNDLTGERYDIVGVRIRNEDTAWFQKFGCRVQAFRTEFVVTKRSQKLAHQNVALDVSLKHAHISCKKCHSIFEFLFYDHVSQGHNGIWVFVKSYNTDLNLRLLSCLERFANEWTATSTKIHDCYFLILYQDFLLISAWNWFRLQESTILLFIEVSLV